MLERLVEIAEDGRHLSLNRGFLVVKESKPPRAEVGRVPIDDIGGVIAHAHGLSYSNNLLVALAQRGIPFVLCASNHNVVGMLWPMAGHHQQSERMESQLTAKKTLKKQLWAAIVKSKLELSASVLEAVNAPSESILALIKKVRSGDPDNIEAQAARRYWPLLMGATFKRDRELSGVNALLNYGYSVYRAAMARAVVASGLHPSIGLHHCNRRNTMRLVDDLIEPFRSIVDYQVWRLLRNKQAQAEVSPSNKKALALSLYWDRVLDGKKSPVTLCMQSLAGSLAKVFAGKADKLLLPSIDVTQLRIE